MPTTDPNTITSASLAPTAPIQYATPNPVPIPPVDGLDANGNLTETQPEKDASDLSTKLQALNDQLIGKSADQTQEEANAGIPGLQQTQQDLSTQLAQLKNEAAAIPQQLQIDSSGRGITSGGLNPIQTARLRTNSIAALGVSSLLDATNGLLASAQTKADKAVAAKYDPIQEEIDAATKNLNLIINSPDYSVADKNRANAQLAIQNQKQAQLDKDTQNTKDVNTVALQAAENGADAVTLQNIMASPDQASAIQAAGTSLQAPASTSVEEINGRQVLINSKTGETIKDLGPKDATGGTGITVPVSDGKGNQVQVPVDVAPYYNTSQSGIGYIDASTLEGTAAQKKQIIDKAQAAGIKPILNKNTAADLSNIKDANNKLDTISTIMSGIDQPGPISRALYGMGLTKLAVLAQSNPQQAAAGALQSVGLDILKAVSGVQGFRGNASVIQQINDHMPTIYDTDAVAQQKVDYIRQLISDREDGLLGTPTSKSVDLSGFENGGTGLQNSGSTSNGVDLTKFNQ